MSSSAKQTQSLAKAMALFWRQGFLGTSMRQLQDAMDMRPGSIYARYGGKDGLYRACMDEYRHARTAELNQCLEQSTSALEGLKSFIQGQLLGRADELPSQCLLQRTVEDLSSDEGELRTTATRYLKEWERHFAALLVAKSESVLSADDLSLGRWFQIQFMGLRAYKGLGADNQTLTQLIDDVFDGVQARLT